jgi:hypothetical protein
MKRPLIAWGGWLTLLVGLGVGLYLLLPPEPRWCLPPCGPIDLTLGEEGRFLAWQDESGGATGAAILRNLRTGEPIRAFFVGVGGFGGLICAPAGNWIARHDSETVRVAAVADGTEHTISFPKGVSVAGVQFADHDEVIAVYLHDRHDDQDAHHRVALIDTATGDRLAEVRGALSNASSAQGGKLLLVAVDVGEQTILKAWDVRERRWAFQIERSIANWTMSPDGRTLVSHAHPPGTRDWMICDGERGTVEFTGPEKSGLNHLSFAADGRRVAIRHGKALAPHVEVFDLDARRRLLHIDDVWSPQIALSPDGRRLALQTLIRPGDDAQIAVAVLDVDTGRRLWQQNPTPASHFWVAPNPTFGPDGRTVVVYRHAPHRAEILDAETGTLLATLPLAGADVFWNDSSVTAAPDHRTQIVHAWVTPGRRPDWWPDLLDRVLPTEIVHEFITIDVEARRVLGRLQVPATHDATLLDGGRLVLTTAPADGDWPRRVCCWDLPPRAPWRWIIGIPAALAALTGAAAWWRHRRRVH